MSCCAAIMIKNDIREIYLSNRKDGYPSVFGQWLRNILEKIYKNLEINEYISIDRIAIELISFDKHNKLEDIVIPRAEYLYIINSETRKLTCIAIPAYDEYNIDTLQNCGLEWTVDF